MRLLDIKCLGMKLYVTRTEARTERITRFNWAETDHRCDRTATSRTICVAEQKGPGDYDVDVEYEIRRGSHKVTFRASARSRSKAFRAIRREVMAQFRLTTLAANSQRVQLEPSADWEEEHHDTDY